MRAYVGVTDRDWFEFLRARPALDEVNFWQPSAQRPFGAIQPGELFLFKLKYPVHKIVGGGMLAWSGTFPYPYVWELFGEKNGAATGVGTINLPSPIQFTPLVLMEVGSECSQQAPLDQSSPAAWCRGRGR